MLRMYHVLIDLIRLFYASWRGEAKVSTQFTLLDALMEMEENLKEEKS